MRVMTVDPGLIQWALAVFDDGQLLYSETFSYKSKESQESRLSKIHSKVIEFEFDHLVVERQFVDIMGQICGTIRRSSRKSRHKNNNASTIFLEKTINWIWKSIRGTNKRRSAKTLSRNA
jgi:hypothetical protein